jgi:hypothetical protein
MINGPIYRAYYTFCIISSYCKIPFWQCFGPHPLTSALTNTQQPPTRKKASIQLLGEGQVAPGVTFAELKKRRTKLAAALPDNSVAIVPSAPQRYVTGVIPYPYRQDADFYWLTGIMQPGVAVLHKRQNAGVLLAAGS